MLPLESYNSSVKFTRPVGIDGLDWPMTIYYVNRSGFKQKRPYNVDTPFEMTEHKHLAGAYSSCEAWNWTLVGSAQETSASNQARARFVSKLGDNSSFGATLTAERKETWNSVVSIITRAAGAARAVSRMRFHEAAGLLGLPFSQRTKRRVTYRTDYISKKNGLGKRKVKSRIVTNEVVFSYGTGREYVKTLANGWLMWSYGVKPLMSDIYNGMDVLQRPFPYERIKASGHADYKSRSPLSGAVSSLLSGSANVTVAAYVRVSNPNLWLMNKMGLVNPAQWINEAIPFSFVVDWFSNLSNVIMQMTDFVGLEIDRPCTCTKTVEVETRIDAGRWNGSKQRTTFIRRLSIPSVKLTFAYERFEWQRGLNAISLLIGFIRK